MLNIHQSSGELVIAFHTLTSHEPTKTSCGELSRGKEWEQPGSKVSPPHLLTSTDFSSENIGLGRGKHVSPEATDGKNLSPPSLLMSSCTTVLQISSSPSLIPICSQGLH